MSSKKSKKRQKNFQSYPELLETISEVAELLGVTDTEIIEAACAFFVDCPREFQGRMLAYYHFWIANVVLDPSFCNSNQERIQKLLDEIRSGSD